MLRPWVIREIDERRRERERAREEQPFLEIEPPPPRRRPPPDQVRGPIVLEL